ncbi:MAG: hypothetical protein H7319_11350 [Spirosoma sp.]|nr:hypothetical protein [Spirosoma sp.]
MRINLNDPDALFIPLISDYGFKVVFGNERGTPYFYGGLYRHLSSLKCQ